MDIFSHALWGATVVRKKPLVWWAFLFGAGPDILGSAPATFYRIFAHNKLWSSDTWSMLTPLLKNNYSFWHSLPAAVLIFIILSLFGKRYWILGIPYLLHIVIDLLTHTTDLPYRLFYPFITYNSNRVIGTNWWENWNLWWIFTVLLVGINVFIFLRQHRNPTKN